MGMGLRGFSGRKRAFFGALGADCLGLGREIARQAAPWAGRILRSPPALGEASPLPFGPQGFFLARRGVGRDLSGTGCSF